MFEACAVGDPPFSWVSNSFAHKCWTMVEVTDREKGPSLMYNGAGACTIKHYGFVLSY